MGAEWRRHNGPVGVFVEAVPGIGLLPRGFTTLQGGAGVRAYF
jgi:hypothetical protein